jgi:uncharacterized protein YcbX
MRLTALNRYVLKSCRGESLAAAAVTPMGIEHDRSWMLADAAGRMLSAREEPRLLLLQARCDGREARFTAPAMPELRTHIRRYTEAVDCSVWKYAFAARAGDPDADRWFSTCLERDLRLLYIGAPSRRHLRADASVPLSFADGYPLLAISQASLEDLNARLGRPVAMANFRPNLVIDGCAAYAEDGFKRLRVGEVEFEVGPRCARCVVTTIDPDTAIRAPDREPLLTLAGYRRFPEGTCFGVNLIVRRPGALRVGDALTATS